MEGGAVAPSPAIGARRSHGPHPSHGPDSSLYTAVFAAPLADPPAAAIGSAAAAAAAPEDSVSISEATSLCSLHRLRMCTPWAAACAHVKSTASPKPSHGASEHPRTCAHKRAHTCLQLVALELLLQRDTLIGSWRTCGRPIEINVAAHAPPPPSPSLFNPPATVPTQPSLLHGTLASNTEPVSRPPPESGLGPVHTPEASKVATSSSKAGAAAAAAPAACAALKLQWSADGTGGRKENVVEVKVMSTGLILRQGPLTPRSVLRPYSWDCGKCIVHFVLLKGELLGSKSILWEPIAIPCACPST